MLDISQHSMLGGKVRIHLYLQHGIIYVPKQHSKERKISKSQQ